MKRPDSYLLGYWARVHGLTLEELNRYAEEFLRPDEEAEFHDGYKEALADAEDYGLKTGPVPSLNEKLRRLRGSLYEIGELESPEEEAR